ncbi:hypothetical protein CUW_1930 [Turicibacter sanguinis PC909]|uniref:Mobilization protein n=1 Tax=Turicibacter sanguinis PC909 TaxID=702450 RepID=A0ABP2HXW4_9FIRM|nr:hypothetical protein [Turicibacter sanguinis]EFF62524.1 hypothetical protein CUW_1930 [Turicibacter sanguinis PC909]
MKKTSKQSNKNRAEESTEKLRKTLVFSKKNADIYDELEKMKKKNINISEYICTLIREDLNKKINQSITDNKLEQIQSQLDFIQNLIQSKTFISTNESKTETPLVEVVSAKDIVVDDIEDMLGL